MKIVILTGAGISAESGLNTFRDSDGLWEGHRVEDVATPEAFERDPRLVNDFYNTRRTQLGTVKPNPAHQALARLEQFAGEGFLLVTQNVDDLHERGGSKNLLHLHGELLKKRCQHCGIVTPCHGDIHPEDTCANCHRSGGMRPDIVWFGEMPFHLDEIGKALGEADLFIAIGTSALVYPAANFFAIAAAHGARTVEVNLAATVRSSEFDELMQGPASEQVPRLVSRLTGGS